MFERAHEADPRNPIPLWNTYFLYANLLKDPRRAEAAARALVALDPDVAHTRHVLAWSLVMQRRFAGGRGGDAGDPADRSDPHLGPPEPRSPAAAAGSRRGGDRGLPQPRQPRPRCQQGADALSLGLALRAAGHRGEAESVSRTAAEAMRARGRKSRLDSGDEALLAALLAVAGRHGGGPGPPGASREGRRAHGRERRLARQRVRVLGEADRAGALYERAVTTAKTTPTSS